MGAGRQRFEPANQQVYEACQQRTLRLGNAKMGRTRCDRAAMMGTITNPVGPTMKSKLRSRGAFLLYASQQKHVD